MTNASGLDIFEIGPGRRNVDHQQQAGEFQTIGGRPLGQQSSHQGDAGEAKHDGRHRRGNSRRDDRRGHRQGPENEQRDWPVKIFAKLRQIIDRLAVPKIMRGGEISLKRRAEAARIGAQQRRDAEDQPHRPAEPGIADEQGDHALLSALQEILGHAVAQWSAVG
jgi:hypothetical protein